MAETCGKCFASVSAMSHDVIHIEIIRNDAVSYLSTQQQHTRRFVPASSAQRHLQNESACPSHYDSWKMQCQSTA